MCVSEVRILLSALNPIYSEDINNTKRLCCFKDQDKPSMITDSHEMVRLFILLNQARVLLPVDKLMCGLSFHHFSESISLVIIPRSSFWILSLYKHQSIHECVCMCACVEKVEYT